jgi:hypothetical protein
MDEVATTARIFHSRGAQEKGSNGARGENTTGRNMNPPGRAEGQLAAFRGIHPMTLKKLKCFDKLVAS